MHVVSSYYTDISRCTVNKTLNLSDVIPLCYSLPLNYTGFSQHKNYIYSLQLHVSTHMSHLQDRTVFVCNVTVLILGSQTFTRFFYIDVIYCITIGGCNSVIVMVLQLNVLDVLIGTITTVFVLVLQSALQPLVGFGLLYDFVPQSSIFTLLFPVSHFYLL